MHGRVIQGFFIGGRMRPGVAGRSVVAAPPLGGSPRAGAVQPKCTCAVPAMRPGPPRPAFAPLALQPKDAPGAHRSTTAIQTFGNADNFSIDPVAIGLARSGGQPLPQPVLAKMEGAFGADFSRVRVHVGPQASRIGAIAFATGDDLYFASGQYQPHSIKGQQLIGHELAHVIQQRQGRVRTPSAGVNVVQDAALEAEADRLGMKAAMYRVSADHRPPAGTSPRSGMHRGGTVQRSKAVSHFSAMAEDMTDGNINYSGHAFGTVQVRTPRTRGAEESDAESLRYLSQYLFHFAQSFFVTDEAEVEAMLINERIVTAANKPSTMKKILELATANKEFQEFIRMVPEPANDDRGVGAIDHFQTTLMQPPEASGGFSILQSGMLEKTNKMIQLVQLRNNKSYLSSLTDEEGKGKLFFLNGLDKHAEQKLLQMVVSSKVDTNTRIVIRGKKRPCFGCWLCLHFVKNVLGYSKLDFNGNPGKAWKGAIDHAQFFINVANSTGKKKQADLWAQQVMEKYPDTYVSSGSDASGMDQGYDTP